MIQNYTDPIIILKTYDFYKEFYLEIRKWGKPERYNLGENCEQLILELLMYFLAAARKINPKFNLLQANVKLQILKLLIRLAKDIKLLEVKKYLFFESKLVEIGQMLGGWLKTQ